MTTTTQTITKLDTLLIAHGQQGGTIHQFNQDYGIDLLSLSNRDFYKFIYAIYLKRCIQTMPNEYAYSIDKLPEVLERMNKALDNGTYNKDSHAFKLTNKALGLKNTYQCINGYLAS
jgi:hypothetical protein